VDVYYHFRPEREVSPYLGGGVGVNMRHTDITDQSQNDLGANLIGGLRVPGPKRQVFMEGRYTASDVPQVAVLGGVTFGKR